MTSYKHWHAAYTHDLERRDQGEEISDASSSKSTERQPESEDTEVPINATGRSDKLMATPSSLNTDHADEDSATLVPVPTIPTSSYVHIGRFGDKTVRPHDATLRHADARL